MELLVGQALNDIDNAQEITKTLRDAGIAVRINRTTGLNRSVLVTGKIQDFRSLFTREIEQGGETHLQEMYEQALTKVEETAEGITALMDKHSPGEVLDMNPEEMISLPFEGAITKGENMGPFMDKTAGEIMKWIRLYSVLYLNELIEETDDGVMILQRHADPDEIVIYLPLELVSEIKNSRCREHAIRTEMTITSVPVCHVTFGADAIAKLDLKEIDGLVAYQDLDMDRYDTFMENYTTKKIVLEWILDCVSVHGTATAMQVFEMLEKNAICVTEADTEITIETDPEYVKEVLSDMEKAKLIKKTGATYKVI